MDSNERLALSPLQRALVTAEPGRRVFVGGPGAGKTTVLAARTAWLVAQGLATPQQILVLAPSRRAAQAVARLTRRSLGGGHGPEALSFHGLALAALRQHHHRLGYARPPRVLATTEQFSLLRELLLAEDAASWGPFASHLGSSALQALAYDVVMGSAENGLEERDLLARAAFAPPGAPLAELASFRDRYRRHLRDKCLIDFGEALCLLRELLAGHEEVAHVYRASYRHILVDEFEEANYAQAAILSLLAGDETDLLVAGDPGQGIGSFRGGSPVFLTALAERLSARTIVSGENHRAAPRIRGLLDASARTGVAAENQPAPTTGGGQDAGRASLRVCAYPTDEARNLAETICALVRDGAAPGEVAILFRGLGSPLVGLVEHELERLDLPCRRGGGSAVMSEPLLRATVDLLHYLAQPANGGYHLERLLASPLGGLPPLAIGELRRTAALLGVDVPALVGMDPTSLVVSEGVRSALASLRARLDLLGDKAGWSMGALLFEIWRLFPAFAADALGAGQASRAYAALLAEVTGLEEGRRSLSLPELLRRLEAGDFERLQPSRLAAEGVTLTTVHLAKGGQWRFVFLPGLVEGTFPLQRSALDLVAPLLAADLPLDGALPAEALVRARHLAEERRVLRVGLARAREGLFLSYIRYEADGSSSTMPSRFLADLVPLCDEEARAAQAEPSTVEEAVTYYRRQARSLDGAERARGRYGLARLWQGWPERVRPEAWWENVAWTEGAAPAFPEARLHLSASRLGTYRQCPLSYQYGYHWHLYQPQGAPATIGSLLHSVLEDYHRPGNALGRSRETLSYLLDQHFEAKEFPYRPIARQARRTLDELLDQYYGRYGLDGPAEGVELGFGFAFKGHRIAGYVDRVERLPEGGLELIDYKSGQPMTKADAGADLQLALYDLAFHEDGELRALGIPAKVSYLYVKAIGPRADGKRSSVPSDASRRALCERIAYYADALLAERFPSHFELGEAFADLDPEELERVLGKDPCRFCNWTWLCPWQERGGDYV